MLRKAIVLSIIGVGLQSCSSDSSQSPTTAAGGVASGGASSTGGVASGGASSTGGAPFASGGTVSSGGTLATGGSPMTGGAPATGGVFDAGPLDAGSDAAASLALSFANCVVSDVGSVPNVNAVSRTSVAAGDLDHDGKVDLVVGTWPDNHVISLKGKGDGSFQIVSTKTTPANPTSIVLADLNRDGWLDAVVGGSTAAASVSVLLGGAGGSLGEPTTYSGFIADGLAVGDLNGDSNLDVVVGNNYGTAFLGSFLGSSNGALSAVTSVPSAMDPGSPVLADFDHDGKLDVVLAADAVDSTGRSSGVVVQLGLGDGTFATPSGYVSGATSPWLNLLGDFNSDGLADVATLDSETNLVTVFLSNGDGTFRTPIQNRLEATTQWAAADFDRDGRLDLAMDAVTNEFYLYRGKGDGTFAQAKSFPVNLNSGPMIATDVNGDGNPDIVYAVHAVGAIAEVCALLNTSH